jgi:acylphosphatase
MRRVYVSVFGGVQGVFYRATCAERARALGVAGWVRNALDGRVEAEFEGESPAVDALVSWCREGPPRARVEAVEVTELEPIGDSGFRVTA